MIVDICSDMGNLSGVQQIVLNSGTVHRCWKILRIIDNIFHLAVAELWKFSVLLKAGHRLGSFEMLRKIVHTATYAALEFG